MNDQIKAKVRVSSIVSQRWGSDNAKHAEQVRMHPVYGDSDENKTFSEATPSGTIELTITNKSAWGFFVEDKEYYVDITPTN